ncbi:MAG: protein YgfX [Rudaea sp.]
MRSAPAIAFDYRPSRWLLAATLVITVLALVALAFSGVPVVVKMALGIFVCAQAGFGFVRFLRPPLQRVAWQPGGHWHVIDADGREHVAELTRGTVRGAWIVLNLRRTDDRRITLILAPDNADVDTRRRLRVRLGREQETAPAT